MKKLLLLLTLAPGWAMAQQAKIRLPDLGTIEQLMASKATLKEANTRLGQASSESITPGNAYLEFRVGEEQWTLGFNDKHVLTDAYYNSKSVKTSGLAYEDVKKASTLKDRQSVQERLGMPQRLVIRNGSEEWMFDVREGKDDKRLVVTFDLNAGMAVKKYSYYARFNDKTGVAIAPETTDLLKKGYTTPAEMEKRLGLPSHIMIDQTKEQWEYTSDNTQLVIFFDAQSKLSDYTYRRKAQ
jgi:hypothetical protein